MPHKFNIGDTALAMAGATSRVAIWPAPVG
jgi:hypothetical protein